MIRRWLRGCLLPSALCLTAAGCTTSIESLTGGFITSGTPGAKGRGRALRRRATATTCRPTTSCGCTSTLPSRWTRAGNDQGALEEYERVLAAGPEPTTPPCGGCASSTTAAAAATTSRRPKRFTARSPTFGRRTPTSGATGATRCSCAPTRRIARRTGPRRRRSCVRRSSSTRSTLGAHTNLGLVLGQIDRYDEAYREFRAAQLSEAEAHCDMAFVYWQKGRMEDAKQECRIARDKDPALAKASEMLTVLEQAGHPHEKGGPLARGEGRPRNSMTAAEREEAEHEAARRAVAGLTGGTSASIPMPSSVMSAPDVGKVVKWQTSGPIVMPSGNQLDARRKPAPHPRQWRRRRRRRSHHRRRSGNDHVARIEATTFVRAARRQPAGFITGGLTPRCVHSDWAFRIDPIPPRSYHHINRSTATGKAGRGPAGDGGIAFLSDACLLPRGAQAA